MTTAVREALIGVRERLDDLYGDRLVRVILYGSQARGEARLGSDVDVLVVLSGSVDVLSELQRLATLKLDVLGRYGVYFSLQPYSEEAYQDRGRPLMMHVHAEGVEL